MIHPAAMAYNFNLLQAQNRGSPVPYSGVAHPSPLGMGQASPDKEPQTGPVRNGVALYKTILQLRHRRCSSLLFMTSNFSSLGKLEASSKSDQSCLRTPERKINELKEKQASIVFLLLLLCSTHFAAFHCLKYVCLDNLEVRSC